MVKLDFSLLLSILRRINYNHFLEHDLGKDLLKSKAVLKIQLNIRDRYIT